MVVAAEFRQGLCHVLALCERTTGLSEFDEQKTGGDALGSSVGAAPWDRVGDGSRGRFEGASSVFFLQPYWPSDVLIKKGFLLKVCHSC